MADPDPPSRPSSVAPSSPSRISKPSRKRVKRVIYKSSTLERTAPTLNNTLSSDAVSQSPAIQNANDIAERVRDDFHSTLPGRKPKAPLSDATHLVEDPSAIPINGTDDESNAKKYERRLKMNRKSAAASRLRREAYTKALENEVVGLEAALKEVNALLKKEKARHVPLENDIQMSDDPHHLPQSPPSTKQPHSPPPQEHTLTDSDHHQPIPQFDTQLLPEAASLPVPPLEDPPAVFFAHNLTPSSQSHPPLPNQQKQHPYLPYVDPPQTTPPCPTFQIEPDDVHGPHPPSNGTADPHMLSVQEQTKHTTYSAKMEDVFDGDDLLGEGLLAVEEEYRKLLSVSDDHVDAEFFLAFSPEDGYPPPPSSRL